MAQSPVPTFIITRAAPGAAQDNCATKGIGRPSVHLDSQRAQACTHTVHRRNDYTLSPTGITYRFHDLQLRAHQRFDPAHSPDGTNNLSR